MYKDAPKLLNSNVLKATTVESKPVLTFDPTGQK